jgi:uroporphyrinogen-III synthase
MAGSALEHRRILVTRAEPGALADLLIAAGAEVIHLPLIAMIDPLDGGEALQKAIGGLGSGDWLVVTSPEGARRVVAAGPDVVSRSGSDSVRIAAVGRATAAVVEAATKKAVDIVPEVQTAAALLERLQQLSAPSRIVVAHGDLADPGFVVDLELMGHHVSPVEAYRTVEVAPPQDQLRAALTADALVLASGSAARSWAQHCAGIRPPVICAIGPSTAAAAAEVGIVVTHHAEVSSIEGILSCLNQAFDPGHPTME